MTVGPLSVCAELGMFALNLELALAVEAEGKRRGSHSVEEDFRDCLPRLTT